MPGSAAVFIGRMGETLPVTLLVFSIAYGAAKKKWGLSNSMPRVVSLFCYAFVLSGLAFAVLHDAIATGFGTITDGEMQDTFEIPAEFGLALCASLLVIATIGRPRRESN